MCRVLALLSAMSRHAGCEAFACFGVELMLSVCTSSTSQTAMG